MKISELKDKKGNVNMDLVIIWDKAQPEEKFGKTIKSVIVKDADSEKGDDSPSAYLDLYNEDAEKYKIGNKIRIIDAYSKLIQGKNQFRITNAHKVENLDLYTSEPEDKAEIADDVTSQPKSSLKDAEAGIIIISSEDIIKENNLLREWITRNYGERCKDYNSNCANCKAWDYYTKLKYDEE